MVKGTGAEAIAPILDAALRCLDQHVRVFKVFLFGSFAQGRATSWSDIDLAVVSPDFGANPIAEAARLMELLEDVDMRIEPKAYSVEEFLSARRGSFLCDEVISKGLEITASSFRREESGTQTRLTGTV